MLAAALGLLRSAIHLCGLSRALIGNFFREESDLRKPSPSRYPNKHYDDYPNPVAEISLWKLVVNNLFERRAPVTPAFRQNKETNPKVYQYKIYRLPSRY
jgi:hypothetical protein